jgi:hypothetical protein
MIMQKPFPCVESTKEFKIQGFIVRVWRDEDRTNIKDEYDNEDLVNVAHKLSPQSGWHSISKLALVIAAEPRVNAVQVKDAAGDGIVLYVNWP